MVRQVQEAPTWRSPGLRSSGALGRFPFSCRSLVASSLVWLLTEWQRWGLSPDLPSLEVGQGFACCHQVDASVL